VGDTARELDRLKREAEEGVKRVDELLREVERMRVEADELKKERAAGALGRSPCRDLPLPCRALRAMRMRSQRAGARVGAKAPTNIPPAGALPFSQPPAQPATFPPARGGGPLRFSTPPHPTSCTGPRGEPILRFRPNAISAGLRSRLRIRNSRLPRLTARRRPGRRRRRSRGRRSFTAVGPGRR
jgi:hypothetical protein